MLNVRNDSASTMGRVRTNDRNPTAAKVAASSADPTEACEVTLDIKDSAAEGI
jgi:hypothetical protein